LNCIFVNLCPCFPHHIFKTLNQENCLTKTVVTNQRKYENQFYFALAINSIANFNRQNIRTYVQCSQIHNLNFFSNNIMTIKPYRITICVFMLVAFKMITKYYRIILKFLALIFNWI
jgi:hypothetical protein